MDTKILEEIGLTNGEIKAYLALLKLGSSSTGPIAKESQVSRSKLYGILDKLEKKGLASHVEQNGVIYFQAVEPSRIKDYITAKENNLKELKKDFENFLPQLESFHKESSEVQSVKVYQGFKGIRTAHEHLYLSLKRGDEYYCLGIPAEQPDEQHIYWQKDHLRRIEEGLKCKLLFNKDADIGILKNRNSFKDCDARYMPIDVVTPALFFMYKDATLIMIQSINPVAIEIVSEDITSSFREYFNEFWKLSKRFKD
jgi:sugar-specific transcriptional regulator TrmB